MILDFNNTRRRHFSPEEMKLCRQLERQLEAELDIERDDDELDDAPAGNGHDPDPAKASEPAPEGIDFNGARRQDKSRTGRIDADVMARVSTIMPKSFIGWLFGGRALITEKEARIGNIRGEAGIIAVDCADGRQ